MLSFTSEHALAENVAPTANYSHFFAGDFIQTTGLSEVIDFFELTSRFKF